MNTKIVLLFNILILFLLVGAGCVKTNTPIVIENPLCSVQSCHFENYDISCASKPVGPCTQILKPTDFCGKFVSCTNFCTTVKTPEFDICLDCFKKCNNDKCEITNDCLNKFPKFKEQFPLLVENSKIQEEINGKIKYKNDIYGFSLELPIAWKGYTITEEKATNNYSAKQLNFNLNNEMLFAILAFTKDEFAKINTKEYPMISNSKIGENSSFIFIAVGNQDTSESLYQRRQEMRDIIETFKAY